ncbi:SMI1/KNR4 family protein [Actinomadura sp. KC216]|uniref:SMI1/KNR4 family protein n=1 Tax=Actinomadura sp. KC216 TaxID=2530370 RepID=UPI00104B9CB1|nr:SMI1/KNR4 family protein [Actinomadura sp. KC216]TDB78869.1 SMI1/KNR4 family protein [Actinomadura sp. KC216]
MPRFPTGAFPEDYATLLSQTGPGTLAGVLRLLVPGCGVDGFDIETEQRNLVPPHPEARLWGVFASGETCWWLPVDDDPARWLVALDGHGRQQLNLTTTEFLEEWLDGLLDLPVLSLPPVPRERTLTPAGQRVEPAVPASSQPGTRNSLAQLQTIIGPGTPGTYEWEDIEQELGVPRLPADYKRLYETYYSDHWIVLNGIFIEHPHDLASSHETHAESMREWGFGSGPRHPLHPEPGGLLYCAGTEGRASLWWDTRDPDPDRWPIWTDRRDTEELWTITEFLVAELTGVGLDLTDSSLGNPADWAWPIWGPRRPR